MLLSGFPPVARRDARVLILGSMPSETSLAQDFYYAHPANAFWWLLAGVLDCAVPIDVAAKRRLLTGHRIALWDVVHRCRRRGSLDAAIERDHPRLCFVRLPSSSPANASWSRERKLAAWRAVSAALRT